jgi:hypothetical protein
VCVFKTSETYLGVGLQILPELCKILLCIAFVLIDGTRKAGHVRPLASERLEYLKYLIGRGAVLGTVLKQGRYCLCIAHEMQPWPREHCLHVVGLLAIAAAWAAGRVAQGRATAPRWPKEQFCSVACIFLERLGRLVDDPDPLPGRFDAWLELALKKNLLLLRGERAVLRQEKRFQRFIVQGVQIRKGRAYRHRARSMPESF